MDWEWRKLQWSPCFALAGFDVFLPSSYPYGYCIDSDVESRGYLITCGECVFANVRRCRPVTYLWGYL